MSGPVLSGLIPNQVLPPPGLVPVLRGQTWACVTTRRREGELCLVKGMVSRHLGSEESGHPVVKGGEIA